MENKIIYYYQTFDGLNKIINNPHCTHIHISSIHFGMEKDNVTPYIHLNNLHPNDKCFDTMWKEVKILSHKGIKIVLMMGGAGGAFKQLLKNFDVYYLLFKQTLLDHPIITGIDLNVEENIGLHAITKVISHIKKDFPSYSLSMAPIQYALTSCNNGLGGFKYKELLQTSHGKHIDYLNGQFYIDYSFESFEQCVKNGFNPNQIVMGMLSSQYNKHSIKRIKRVLQKIKRIYPQFGGVFIWEQFNSYSQNTTWDIDMKNILNMV